MIDDATNKIVNIIGLTCGAFVIVLQSVYIIKSKCCNSECVLKLKNQKNNSDNNIETNNV